MAALAVGPTQSAEKATSLPSRAARGRTTGSRLMLGTRRPLGRSKWDSSTTLAPLACSLRMVGMAARRRVSSDTQRPRLLSAIGTLKSTRTRAVLPAMSPV